MQKAFNLPFYKCQIREYETKTKRDGLIKRIMGYISPASLSSFRKRIGEEGVLFIADNIYSSNEFKNKIKSRRVVVDTTAIQSDIKYPTDINLP